jgi:hypothetical protein
MSVNRYSPFSEEHERLLKEIGHSHNTRIGGICAFAERTGYNWRKLLAKKPFYFEIIEDDTYVTFRRTNLTTLPKEDSGAFKEIKSSITFLKGNWKEPIKEE